VTIGSISIAFKSDLSDLESGIEKAIDLVGELKDAVKELQDSVGEISKTAVSVIVDKSSIEQASKAVDALRKKASDASGEVSVTAEASSVASAATATEELGEAVAATGEQATRSRSALASLVITSAQVAIAAQQAVARYADFRTEFLAFVRTATGAETAAQAVGVAIRGLRGDVDSLRAIFGALGAGLEGAVSGFLSVENVNGLLQASLGGVLRLFGFTDDAVRASIGVLSDFVTRQVALAASNRLVQRSLSLVGQAYDTAADSLARFLTETASGRAAASAIERGLLVVVRAASEFDARFGEAVSSIGRFLTSSRLIGSVSATVGSAFDAASSAVGDFISRAISSASSVDGLRERLSAMLSEALKLIPSMSGVTDAVGGFVASAARAVPTIANIATSLASVLDVFTLVSAASRRETSIFDFTAAVASTAAMSAGLGAVTGAATSLATGGSVLAGAWGGATAALSGFAAILPATIALSVAAAVATGRMAGELQHVGQSAQQLGDLSDRFEQPVQEIEKLRIAAQNTNVDFGSVVKSTQVFQSNLSKVKVGQLGSRQAREAKAAFDTLGVSVEDMQNKKPQEVFADVAKAISEIEDPAKRTQLAMDVFGKAGPRLMPLLKNLEQINEDIKRLGGTISDVDFKRFTDVNQSFDRLKTASGAMADDLMIPFTRMQEAMNNAKAEIIGGLAPVFGELGQMIADVSAPIAVFIEIVARIVGTVLRVAAAVVKLVAVFQPFATIASVAEIVGDEFNKMWTYVEYAADVFEEFASSVKEYLGDSVESVLAVGEAIRGLLNWVTSIVGLGNVFGELTVPILAVAAAFAWAQTSAATYTAVMQIAGVQSVVSAVTSAAAWVAFGATVAAVLVVGAVVAIGVYIAGVITAMATTIASCAAMHVAWLFGLGPIGLAVAAVELLIVAMAGIWALGGSIVDFFSGFGEGKKKIDGARASTEELAEVVAENEKPRESGFASDMEALSEATGITRQSLNETWNGFTSSMGSGFSSFVTTLGEATGASDEEIEAMKSRIEANVAAVADIFGEEIPVPDLDVSPFETAKQVIGDARNELGEFSIRAAQLGTPGADAAAAATERFSELQKSLGDGKISLEEFQSESSTLAKQLGEDLEEIAKSSPEETLKRNLEVFKEMDAAAKQAAKSAREIGADVMIGDQLFPRSEEVKNRAKQYSQEYADALDDIKKRLASGEFQIELDQKKKANEEDFAAGKIDKETFTRTKRELDTSSAQEQAGIAAEEVQREFDQKNAKLKVELDFADGIRKSLEDAFLSPVEKFQKELDKIENNTDLTPEEKEKAEKDLRKKARENLVGKTATEQFTDRNRDIQQGLAAGLITDSEAENEVRKNADALAQSLGFAVDPANAMKNAVSNLDQALKDGVISVEQHADGLNKARRSFLEGLGIKTAAETVDAEKLGELQKQRDAGNISQEEFDRGKKSLSDSIVGQSAADRIGEQRRRIEAGVASGIVDKDQGAAALRKLDSDRRSAAGIEDTAGQQVQSGVDKINDAFGVTGKTMAEIQASLSPQEFAEYQKAIKQNTDKVKESLGVEKTGAQKFAESREKLDQAMKDGVINAEERDKALKKQRDSLLSSLGIDKSPAEDFQDAVEKIRENAAELSPDEIAKGLKAAKDKLLSALGIDKSPAEAASESLKKLNEAFAKGQITQEEFAKGAQKARDTLLQSLGIPLDPVNALRDRMNDLQEAFSQGLITQKEFAKGQEEARRSMIPGGEAKSPVEQFRDDLDAVNRAVEQGLISEQEGAARKLNLQADLQENMKPALDNLQQDRRQVGASDVRSREGVDTFFRILQGRDNPSLKAQLEIARNTRLLAQAAQDPDAAPVIAQLSAR
jgi:hypothetical protein